MAMTELELNSLFNSAMTPHTGVIDHGLHIETLNNGMHTGMNKSDSHLGSSHLGTGLIDHGTRGNVHSTSTGPNRGVRGAIVPVPSMRATGTRPSSRSRVMSNSPTSSTYCTVVGLPRYLPPLPHPFQKKNQWSSPTLVFPVFSTSFIYIYIYIF